MNAIRIALGNFMFSIERALNQKITPAKMNPAYNRRVILSYVNSVQVKGWYGKACSVALQVKPMLAVDNSDRRRP
jgi:hypothetical protein